MRVAIYARVSTDDKGQDPDTQLLPLREFVAGQGWTTAGEFVDQASAADMTRRTAWREFLASASRHKIDLLLVWKMDRAFRSVLDAAITLERLRAWHVGLRSYTEPWLDTTSPFGEALYYMTAAYAQLERGIMRERIIAGQAKAKAKGVHIGRRATYEPAQVAAALTAAGSVRGAATRLHCSRATVKRVLGPEVTAQLLAEAASRRALHAALVTILRKLRDRRSGGRWNGRSRPNTSRRCSASTCGAC